ncbi:MAG: hypothetical protein ACXW1D_00690 [Halobacteriota archaeon]
MAVVSVTSKQSAAPISVASIPLGTSGDTLVYTPGQGDELMLYNSSASPVVVTIDGNGGTTIPVPGAAGATFSVATGLTVTVAANSFAYISLDKASAYLSGTVAISAATASVVKAAIVTQY